MLYAIAEAIVEYMASGPGFFATMLYIALAWIPVALVHELGHAVAARVLLGVPVHVEVGSSGKVARLRVARISMAINALADPTRVGGLAAFDDEQATVRDIVLIALAGPAASLVGFLAGVWALGVTSGGLVRDLLWAITLGGAGACFLNLLPFVYQERRHGPEFRTDGRIVLDALGVARSQGPRAARVRRSRGRAAPSREMPQPGHEPLRGRGGAVLGVEPLPRSSMPDPADDGLERRARRLRANKHRSVPPPSDR